ncbi:ketopantoate reductase family protein [Marinobacter sp. S6332]|uniref:ketopantoate reductase family protein n=1 Tax=Marinobacter sp. S6332 TaxID=2926403 RepID=UPI001FF29461|nr:ketopantoate reductase family protein [Marinobacter sp. S6332]MCK0164759.1 ketopantoate reductase family protein [Marinobacter sp. S6332]
MVSADERSGGGGVIAILGAGSLGRLWAALLPSGQCGFLPRCSGGELRRSFSLQEVPPETRCEYILVHSAPPSMAPQGFGRDFLKASPDSGEACIHVDLPWLRSAENVKLLLVTTKAGDTLTGLNDWLPHTPDDTPVVLFQNGLGSQQAVAERWPQRPILAASTTEGANRPSQDVLVHAGAGDTWVGALTASAAEHVTGVVQQLTETGLRIHAENKILQRLWQKLVVNAGINPFTALLDCPNGDILALPLYQQNIDGLCSEISLLLQAETSEAVAPLVLRERIEKVARNTAGNTSSMRADVIARRKTEINFINGYLVQCGKRHGIATPVNQMLTERVKGL